MTGGRREISSTHLISHLRGSRGGRDEENKNYQEKEMNKEKKIKKTMEDKMKNIKNYGQIGRAHV